MQSYFIGGWPKDLRTAHVKQWHEENDPKSENRDVATGTQRFVPPPNYSDLLDHLYNFFESVREDNLAL